MRHLFIIGLIAALLLPFHGVGAQSCDVQTITSAHSGYWMDGDGDTHGFTFETPILIRSVTINASIDQELILIELSGDTSNYMYAPYSSSTAINTVDVWMQSQPETIPFTLTSITVSSCELSAEPTPAVVTLDIAPALDTFFETTNTYGGIFGRVIAVVAAIPIVLMILKFIGMKILMAVRGG